jgi:hypothetical protein
VIHGILPLIFIGSTFASTGWAQQLRANPDKFAVKEDEMMDFTKDFEGRRKARELGRFGGLDPQIAGRAKGEILDRGSLLELLVFFGGQFEVRAKLDQNQRPEFLSALEKRKRQREETVEEAFRQIREMSPFDENGYRLIMAKAWKKEDEHEAVFSKSMSDILDPTQLDTLCKAAMGYLRPEFARHPLIASHMKLTKEQIAKFDRWRLENHKVVKQESDYRQSLQKDSRAPTDQQEIEVEKFFKGITTNFVNYARDADNSLTKEQFQFVARATGMIREDETLDEYYNRLTEAEQTKLAAVSHHFERIHADRRK